MTSTPPPPEPHNPPPATRAEAAQSGSSVPPSAYAAPASPTENARPKTSNRLGLIAFVASLLGVVIGSILATFGGIQSGSLAQFAGSIDSTGTVDPEALPEAANQIGLLAGLLIVAAFLVWGAFALWGLIQGIIAAVKNRGRGWGIAAIILSVVGGAIVLVVFLVAAGIGAAPYTS